MKGKIKSYVEQNQASNGFIIVNVLALILMVISYFILKSHTSSCDGIFTTMSILENIIYFFVASIIPFFFKLFTQEESGKKAQFWKTFLKFFTTKVFSLLFFLIFLLVQPFLLYNLWGQSQLTFRFYEDSGELFLLESASTKNMCSFSQEEVFKLRLKTGERRLMALSSVGDTLMDSTVYVNFWRNPDIIIRKVEKKFTVQVDSVEVVEQEERQKPSVNPRPRPPRHICNQMEEYKFFVNYEVKSQQNWTIKDKGKYIHEIDFGLTPGKKMGLHDIITLEACLEISSITLLSQSCSIEISLNSYKSPKSLTATCN